MESVVTEELTVAAYYRGRNHAFHGDAYAPPKRPAYAESYARGWRHAKSEDRLDRDTEWG